MTVGCASMVSKTVTPKPIGTSIEVSQRGMRGVLSAKLRPDSILGRRLETWLAKKRVAHDDYTTYVPDLVVTGETYQLNLHSDRTIFSWRQPPFSETSTQQSWKAIDEDHKLRHDLLEWLQNNPWAEFRRSGPLEESSQPPR